MSRRRLSWWPLLVVVSLILQSFLPALFFFAPSIALAAEDAPPSAGEHALRPIFLPLILSETPRVPEPAAATPPGAPPAPATDLNLDLNLSLTAEPPWAEPGEVVTFTVTAANTCAEALPAVLLTAPLPNRLVYVAQSAQGFAYDPNRKELTWAAGELAAGAVITGSFQARVPGVALGETITQTVMRVKTAVSK